MCGGTIENEVLPLYVDSIFTRENIQTYTCTQHGETGAGSQGLTNAGRVNYVLVNFPTQ